MPDLFLPHIILYDSDLKSNHFSLVQAERFVSEKKDLMKEIINHDMQESSIKLLVELINGKTNLNFCPCSGDGESQGVGGKDVSFSKQ